MILPEAKFTDNAATPSTAVPTNVVPGVKTVPCADPEKDAVPVVGMDVGGVSYPKANSVKLDTPPEALGGAQFPRAT